LLRSGISIGKRRLSVKKKGTQISIHDVRMGVCGISDKFKTGERRKNTRKVPMGGESLFFPLP
jgi:hypothetical protein